MVRRYRQKNNKKHVLPIIAALLILVGIVIFVLEKTNTISLLSTSDNTNQSEAQTTSDLPSAQSDYNNGTTAEDNKDPGNTLSENQGSAVVTDTNGATSSNTSNPRTSQTGEITVYLPLNNGLIKTGQEISGISTLQTIQYRLIDSVSGVIASGSLNVFQGKFSGVMSFNTNAGEGRLDVFATKADASEYSSIEIPVRFQ